MQKIFKINRTHIAKVRSNYADQMEAVCALLEITESQFCWHQYLQHEAFINGLISPKYQHMRNMLMYSPTFRGLWNNEWAARNSLFLTYAYDLHDLDDQRKEYRYIHAVTQLLNDRAFNNKINNAFKLF